MLAKTAKIQSLVSVHHGTGAGIIVNGQVFLGYNRNVGEIGHIQIDPLGDKCQCGNFGCLETVAADPAIIRHVQALLDQGYPSSLQELEDVTMPAICEAANKGDELASQALIKVGNQLGKALAMTINLFNPQKIIVAGNITQSKDVIFPAIRRCVETQSLSTFNKDLPIVESRALHPADHRRFLYDQACDAQRCLATTLAGRVTKGNNTSIRAINSFLSYSSCYKILRAVSRQETALCVIFRQSIKYPH